MFENLKDELFFSCMRQVAQVLKDTKLSKPDFTCVVLIGGLSRILHVQQIEDAFNVNVDGIIHVFYMRRFDNSEVTIVDESIY